MNEYLQTRPYSPKLYAMRRIAIKCIFTIHLLSDAHRHRLKNIEVIIENIWTIKKRRYPNYQDDRAESPPTYCNVGVFNFARLTLIAEIKLIPHWSNLPGALIPLTHLSPTQTYLSQSRQKDMMYQLAAAIEGRMTSVQRTGDGRRRRARSSTVSSSRNVTKLITIRFAVALLLMQTLPCEVIEILMDFTCCYRGSV